MFLTKVICWIAIFAGATILTTTMEGKTGVTKQAYGHTSDGASVDLYTLNDGKVEARITNYGGIIVSLRTPDRSGKLDDIVLGNDTLDGYIANPAYFGAIIGRYANRIAHGTFQLDGKTYSVPKNDGDNALHGGVLGFNKVVWTARQIKDGIELTYVSKDGEQGFPGTLTTTVSYTLSGGALRIEYAATTDKDTVLNLTNHSYFNLAGEGKGEVLGHVVKINASKITPVDASLIPTGELKVGRGYAIRFSKSSRHRRAD